MPAIRVYPVGYRDQPEHQPDEEYSPPPPELINGPVSKRSCTDLLPCFLLLCALAGLIGITVYGYFNGNPKLLGMVYDSTGKRCGVDAGYEEYPYLYYPIPKSTYAARTVCVAICPQSSWLSLPAYKQNSYFTNVYATSNDPDFISTALSSGNNQDGFFYLYQTTTFFDRLCVPQIAGQTFAQTFNKELLAQDMFGEWVSDLKDTWIVIGICLGIAAIIGIVYVFTFRFAPGFLFFLTMFLMLAAMGGTGYILLKQDPKFEDNAKLVGGDTDTTSTLKNTILAKKILAYAFWALAGLFYALLMLLGAKIKFLNKIMKSVSKYVRATPSLFLIAIFAALVMTVFFALWIFAALYLVSVPNYKDTGTVPFATSKFTVNPRYLLILFAATFFWFSAFVRANMQYIVANSTAFWYYGYGNGQSPPKTIGVSIKRLFRYHMGSIAVGSFVLMQFEFLRVIVSVFQGLKKDQPVNRIIKSIQPSTGCLSSIRKKIMLMNKAAFIQMALSGKEFSEASHDSASLIARNPHWMRTLGGIGSIFAFYGKLFIATISGLAGIAAFTYLDRYSEKIYSPILSLLLIVFFAYQIGSIFVTIYGTAADTLLTCFVIDEEMTEDKNTVPARCPPALKLLMLKLKRSHKYSK